MGHIAHLRNHFKSMNSFERNYEDKIFVNVFSQFRNLISLVKGGALHLNKLESPSAQDTLRQVSMKLAKVI